MSQLSANWLTSRLKSSPYPSQTPSPKKRSCRQQESSYSSFIPAHPLRCGEAGSPCWSRWSWAAVRHCASGLSAERSAASRTGRQCVFRDRGKISTPPRDFRDSRSDEVSKENVLTILRFHSLIASRSPPIKGDSSDRPISDLIRSDFLKLLLSGKWFVRRITGEEHTSYFRSTLVKSKTDRWSKNFRPRCVTVMRTACWRCVCGWCPVRLMLLGLL